MGCRTRGGTGSVLQLLVSLLGLLGMGFDYNSKIAKRNKGFRRVLALLPARSLDQGIDYINTIVETSIANRLPVGMIRVLSTSSDAPHGADQPYWCSNQYGSISADDRAP